MRTQPSETQPWGRRDRRPFGCFPSSTRIRTSRPGSSAAIPFRAPAATALRSPSRFRAREYIYSTGGHFDWFRFANGDARFPGELEALLEELRPDIVHLHHYVNYGVEMLLTIRRTLPEARIVVTLHEYLAICNHFGQMVKRGHFSLCDQASLAGLPWLLSRA